MGQVDCDCDGAEWGGVTIDYPLSPYYGRRVLIEVFALLSVRVREAM